MSDTWHLVCDETKKRIWIGQGWGGMTTLYSDEDETMEMLKRFLNEHQTPKTIRFVNSSAESEIYDYREYK